MLHKIRNLLSILIVFVLANSASAETVRLNSLDGATSLSGEFVEYDGQTYTIKTIVGELIIDAFLVECIGDACPKVSTEGSDFEISGSSTVVGTLFTDLIFKFGAMIGGDTVTSLNADGPTTVQLSNELGDVISDISLSDTSALRGLQDLFNGSADMAVLTRPVTPEENAAFKLSGLGDMYSAEQQLIFGLDGLAILTSKSNSIRAITQQDLAKIFSGQIANWNQIGGADAKINLYVRNETSGTNAVFNDLVMNPAGKSVSATANIVTSDVELSQSVASDPLGIGVGSLSTTGNAKVLNIRGACGIQVPATPFTIKTEEYPLTRRLYIYTTNAEKPAQMQRFMDFLNTEAAQQSIAGRGFVDLGVSDQSNDEQGLRYLSAIIPTDVEMTLGQLREMTTNLMSADRLSITFRFALGSSSLDARAKDDIARLAELLSTGDYDNKEVLLIGFTDSIGAGRGNTTLSNQRASETRAALIAAMPGGEIEGLPIRTLGFGEISPLACNDSGNGRRINRRVEVWFRDTIVSAK